MAKITPSALERKIDYTLAKHFKQYGFKKDGAGGSYRWDMNDDRFIYLATVVTRCS